MTHNTFYRQFCTYLKLSPLKKLDNTQKEQTIKIQSTYRTDAEIPHSEKWKKDQIRSADKSLIYLAWGTVHEHIVAEAFRSNLLLSAPCLWAATITKVMRFKSLFNYLWWLQQKDIWEHRQCVKNFWIRHIKCLWLSTVLLICT